MQQVTCFESSCADARPVLLVMLPRHHREGSTVQRDTGGPCPTLSRAQTPRDRSRPSPCRLCPRHRLLHLCKSTPVNDDSRAHMAAPFPDSCSGGCRNQSTHMITLASPGRINATLGGLGATDGAMLSRTAAPRPTRWSPTWYLVARPEGVCTDPSTKATDSWIMHDHEVFQRGQSSKTEKEGSITRSRQLLRTDRSRIGALQKRIESPGYRMHGSTAPDPARWR